MFKFNFDSKISLKIREKLFTFELLLHSIELISFFFYKFQNFKNYNFSCFYTIETQSIGVIWIILEIK